MDPAGTTRVLGVDPGTRITGWGVVDVVQTRPRYVAHGEVRTSPKAPLWERLYQIHEALDAVLTEHRPTALSLERIFVSKNAQSALKLGHTRGVIMVAALRHGLSVHEYTPGEIKSAVVGSGRADKHQVSHMVRLILGLDAVPPADAGDALAAAICHAHGLGMGAALERPVGPPGKRPTQRTAQRAAQRGGRQR